MTESEEKAVQHRPDSHSGRYPVAALNNYGPSPTTNPPGMTMGMGKHVFRNSLSHSRLNRVVERMVADLDTKLDLKTLALVSGYSKTHFQRMFQAATGCTPYQYLLQLRTRKAQALMNNKSMQLIDIALACGFSSHAQFSRMFRQHIGVTPSEYRRNVK